jgi:hypothetical protein
MGTTYFDALLKSNFDYNTAITKYKNFINFYLIKPMNLIYYYIRLILEEPQEAKMYILAFYFVYKTAYFIFMYILCLIFLGDGNQFFFILCNDITPLNVRDDQFDPSTSNSDILNPLRESESREATQNKSFLKDLHEKYFNKYHDPEARFPDNLKKFLPKISEDKIPVYGSNLVEFKASLLLEKRGISPLKVDLPLVNQDSCVILEIIKLKENFTSVNQLTSDYTIQKSKFDHIISSILNNRENFYPNRSVNLFQEYIEMLPGLIKANEEIAEDLKANLEKKIKLATERES